MHGGEPLTLRWRNVDLDPVKITLVRSLERTEAGLRLKSIRRPTSARLGMFRTFNFFRVLSSAVPVKVL
jgi:hypothetical protein